MNIKNFVLQSINFLCTFTLIWLPNAASNIENVKKIDKDKSQKSGFDLFISQLEMNRTLGILAEMNYVKNGFVNMYSTKFPYRISATITHVMFTWIAFESNLHYSLKTDNKNFDVLTILHLPSKGIVPINLQNFAIEYRCAGSRSGQFYLSLHFNISWPLNNKFTFFTLKQEKICALNDGRRAFFQKILPFENNEYNNENKPWSLTQQNLLYLGIIIIFVFFFIFGFSIFFLNYQSQEINLSSLSKMGATVVKKSSCSSLIGEVSNTKDTILLNESLNVPFINNTEIFSNNMFKQLTSTPYNFKLPQFKLSKQSKIVYEKCNNNFNINLALIELNADRNLFVLMPQIEIEGKYSEIKWANWRQTGIGQSGDIDDEEDDVNEDTALICKTLKQSANRVHFEHFLREALEFHDVPPHPNLAQVSAVATYGNFCNPKSIKDFPLICYRHSGFGILKKFLIMCRSINNAWNDKLKSLTTQLNEPFLLKKTDKNLSHASNFHLTLRTHDLVSISNQILQAIAHLHKFGIIHKDIAARNCLISELPSELITPTEKFYVQLCDCALSRDVFENEYCVFYQNETIEPNTSKNNLTQLLPNNQVYLKPLRWMALESIQNNIYNSSTDIWMFGILMWELFTCGQLPFVDVEPKNIESTLKSGIRPIQPFNCPNEFYDVMFSCWNSDPFERPDTQQLSQTISNFTHQLRKYI